MGEPERVSDPQEQRHVEPFLAAVIVGRCMLQDWVDARDFARYLKRARTRFDRNREATGDRAVSGMSAVIDNELPNRGGGLHRIVSDAR